MATASTFQAKNGSWILEVDLWDGKSLAVRHFVDTDARSYLSYFTKSGRWNQTNINNAACTVVNGSVSYYGIGEWEYFSDAERDFVKSFMGRRTENVWGELLTGWESKIKREAREKYLRNREVRIERMMDEAVPDIPMDFEEWAAEKFQENYALQEKTDEGVRCTCTACRSVWIRPKGMGTKARPCPSCGALIRGTYEKEPTTVPKYKRRGGTKLILMQPCKDNGVLFEKDLEIRKRWLIRFFWADAWWDTEGKHVTVTEGIRIFVKSGHSEGKCWYLHWIGNDGAQFWDTSKPAQWRYGSGYVYPGTLKGAMKLWSEEQRRTGIDILAAKGIKFDANIMIMHAKTHPAWEYLAKNGLTRLLTDDVEDTEIWGAQSSYVHHDGKTAWEVLKINGNRIDRLRQLDGGRIVLKWLRYEETLGLKISTETIRRYEKRGYTPESVWELLSATRSPEKLLNYMEKQAAAAGKTVPWVIGEYRDYLDMARKQGLDLDNALFARPKDLVMAHDECVMYAKSHEIQMKADGIRKKFPKVESVLAAVYGKYAYRDSNYTIVVPQKIEEIIREGRILGHCIDTTDRYFDRIEQNISYLVFLRKTEAPDKPWYTLEIEPGGTVRQQRTTGNNQNRKDAEAYMPFIRMWQKIVRQRITAADRQLAEKSRETRIQEYRELREKKEKVWHGALAGQLLADVLEADLIEEVV